MTTNDTKSTPNQNLSLIKVVGQVLLALAVLAVSACSTLVVNNNELQDNNDLALAQTNSTDSDTESGLEPPKMELNAELLEQLMITNFASYAGDWSNAINSAMSAAELSQDFRLARMASVLALRSEDYEQVVQASELWQKLDADNSTANNTLILGLVGSGDVETAMLKFDQRLLELQQQTSTSSQPNSAEAESDYPTIDMHIRQVAGLLVQQSNAESALKIGEEYIRREPQSAQVLLSMAYVANYFEIDDKAQQWMSDALQLRSNWDAAAQMYTALLARQNKQAERLAYIRLYIKDNPNSVPIRIQYAVELARQQDYQAGFDLMQQVLLDDPDNSNAIIYTAALARQLEEQDVSEDLYERALALEPYNDDVLWALASFAIEDKSYRKAERYYERISQGDLFFRAQLQIANMRYEIKGLKSAINALRFIEPTTEEEFVDVALARHYMLMQDGEHEVAFGYINDSLVYLPDNTDLMYARALVAAELNRVSIAETDLRMIIERFPEHANALNALGYTLADQTDRYEEAKVLISKALELRPVDGHILDSMGWVLYRMQDYQGAISYLLKAYEAMPEAEVAAHLGEVYWQDGQQAQAQQIWQQAYETDATNKVLLETLKRYGQLELYTKKSGN